MERRLYFIGSITFIILGVGHIFIDLLSKYILGPPDISVYNAMLSYKIHVFGFKRNLVEFMEGFSITMGAFMVFYGTLNLILLKKLKDLILKTPAILLFNVLVCLVLVILSIIYFHWPPIICFAISAICFFAIFAKRLLKPVRSVL